MKMIYKRIVALILCVQFVIPHLSAADIRNCSLTVTLQPNFSRNYSYQALLMPVVSTISPFSIRATAYERHAASVLLFGGLTYMVWHHGLEGAAIAALFSVTGGIAAVFIAFPIDLRTLVTTTNLPPASERKALRRVLTELEREVLHKGSGDLVQVVTISDQHGTIDKFDTLILDAMKQALPGHKIPNDFTLDPDRPLQDQLAAFGVQFPDDLRGKLFIHNLGDLMDRGPYGIKVYRRTKELVEHGLSDFIIGNHCFWEALNLQGFHLPWYENYNLYNYQDGYETELGDVKSILTQHHAKEPVTKTKNWWARKLAQFTQYHRTRQATYWKSIDDRVNGSNGLFAHVQTSLTPKSKADRLWEKFHGFNSGHKVSVFTGVHAVGEMSVVWWEKLLLDFNQAYAEIAVTADLKPDGPADRSWKEAISIIEKEILPELRRDRYQHAAVDGEWWWRVFEAMNAQNYSSPEWWAKDWLFHKDWGTSVMTERNAELGARKITEEDYLEDPVLIEIGSFFKRNFVLHIRDIYQNDYMHAFLPVDKNTGEFFFTYKGKEYRGNGTLETASFREGLAQISHDVQNPSNSMSQLYEAYSLINGWYADNTTVAKERDIADAINRHGPDVLASVNGINRLFTGHLPFYGFYEKLGDRLGALAEGFIVGLKFVFTDHGMGEKFGDRGGYIVTGPDGVRMRGYRSKESTLGIEWDPPTAVGSGNSERILFENKGLHREHFLSQLLREVQARLAELGVPGMRNLRDNLLLPLGQKQIADVSLARHIYAYGRSNEFYPHDHAPLELPVLEAITQGGRPYLQFHIQEGPKVLNQADHRLIMVSGNVVLAHANYSIHNASLYLEWINIADPVRELGLSEILLEELFAKARQAGATTLTAHSNSGFVKIVDFYQYLAERLNTRLVILARQDTANEDREATQVTTYRFTFHLDDRIRTHRGYCPALLNAA